MNKLNLRQHVGAFFGNQKTQFVITMASILSLMVVGFGQINKGDAILDLQLIVGQLQNELGQQISTTQSIINSNQRLVQVVCNLQEKVNANRRTANQEVRDNLSHAHSLEGLVQDNITP